MSGNDIFPRIEQRLKAVGLKAAQASREAGLSPDAIRNIMRTGGATAKTISALVPVLQTSTEWLLTGKGEEVVTASGAPIPNTNDVPVMGTAAGSLGEGAFQIGSDPVDWLARPAALAHAKNLYAIYVENHSMTPEHPHGEVRIVNPDKPYKPGDTVIVQVKNGPHDASQAYIKHFVRATADKIVCRQINPVAKIEFSRSIVMHVHKVLTQNEIFGK